MRKSIIAALAASLLLSACSLLPGGGVPDSAPADAAGAQQAYEAAVKKLGVDYIDYASINDTRIVVVGYATADSTQAKVYNAEWGDSPMVSTEDPDGATVLMSAADLDFGSRYEQALMAMSDCTQEVHFTVELALTGQVLTRALCGGVVGDVGYATIGDQEWVGPTPDFATPEGAAEVLGVLDALAVEELTSISFVGDGVIAATTHESQAGPGGQCTWMLIWSTDNFRTACDERDDGLTPFKLADINQDAFGAAVADVYAHSGTLATTGARVEWDDDLGAAIIYTLVPPGEVYGYRIDGTPLQ